MSRMCWRADNSGTTPPHTRWISTCEATTLERRRHGRSASPVSSTSAAAVSSQEVSMPRTIMDGRCKSALQRYTHAFEQLGQRLRKRSARDSALGDDGGHVL